MPGNYCCVPLCNGRGGHKFPKEKTLRKKWLAAIKRDKWMPTDATVVCHRHFKSSNYQVENSSGNYAGFVVDHFSNLVVPLVFHTVCSI